MGMPPGDAGLVVQPHPLLLCKAEEAEAVFGQQGLVGGDHMLAVLDGAPDEFARLFDAAHEFDEHVDFRVVRKDGGVVREAGPVRQVTRLRKVAYQHMLHLNGTPRALDDPLAVLFEDAQEAAAHGAATGHADDQRFHAILHRACRTAGGVCRAGPASCAVRSR